MKTYSRKLPRWYRPATTTPSTTGLASPAPLLRIGVLLGVGGQARPTSTSKERLSIWSWRTENDECPARVDMTFFTAKYSAHARPAAILRLVKLLFRRNPTKGQRWAVVTERIAIVKAQRRQNRCSGIRRGYALHTLLPYTNALFHEKNIRVVLFFSTWQARPTRQMTCLATLGRTSVHRRSSRLPTITEGTSW
jgi:hypothetical protein